MSNFKIGGFSSNPRSPNFQSINSGIILPQVLYMREEPTTDRLKSKARSLNLSSMPLINESFGNTFLRYSKIDLEERTRQTFRDRIFPPGNFLNGVRIFLEANGGDLVSSEIPNLGRLLAGNLMEPNFYEDKKWIDEIPNPVLSFDFYYFLKAATDSSNIVNALCFIKNIYPKLSQSFVATQKPANNPRSKISDNVSRLRTNLVLNTNNANNIFNDSISNFLLGSHFKKLNNEFVKNSIRFDYDANSESFTCNIEPVVGSDRYFKDLLDRYKSLRDSESITRNEKIFSTGHYIQPNSNINKAFLVPTKFFTYEYVNLLFLSLVYMLKQELNNFDTYKYVVYDLLISSIYNSIKNNETFISDVNILPNEFNLTTGDRQIADLNSSLYNLFKASRSDRLLYKTYRDRTSFSINDQNFKRAAPVLSEIYQDVISKDYVKEILNYILRISTYVKELSSESFNAFQSESNSNYVTLSLNRNVFSL